MDFRCTLRVALCRKRSHFRREQMKRVQDLSPRARRVALLRVEAVPERSASRVSLSTKLLVGSAALLVIGVAVEFYAHALAALLLSTCDGVDRNLSERCAWPHKLSLWGFALMGTGALGMVSSVVRRVLPRTARKQS